MGPLTGLKVLEFAGVGPGPMAAMLLADLGATVLRIDRPDPVDLGRPRPLRFNPPFRNRHAIALDLKTEAGIKVSHALVRRADALIEGFRPGTMERLGLGPDVCLSSNPRLVYGRMTGWGQDGPLAQDAGHDINYIAVAGALGLIGREGQPPTVPLNLVGDFGGGALYLVFGIMAALWETQRSGKGQVVDAAIVDGVASLLASYCGIAAAGLAGPRGTGPTDSGSHFYECYRCADGLWLSVGAIEGRFYARLLEGLGLAGENLPGQWDRAHWPAMKARVAEIIATRSQADWCARFAGADACVAPVVERDDLPRHPHLAARRTFIEVDGVVQPAPAPRFSRTPAGDPRPPERAGSVPADVALAGWLSPEEIAEASDALRARAR
jgi:alpha-methylacyl-CoA racemase